MALAKAEGFDITKEEAEAYMDELADFEIEEGELRAAAGGTCWTDCGEDREVPCPGRCISLKW